MIRDWIIRRRCSGGLRPFWKASVVRKSEKVIGYMQASIQALTLISWGKVRRGRVSEDLGTVG